ncbi:HIPA PROTEIN [hydrothermal vent metagenome]|uniref:HIPA PROTEIN n=1 Tax=hydrothermal vent metagenome TaxID=652676 RepID=A0A3B0WU87_9ZZZZ
MISDSTHKEAFVWIWLPNSTEPIVAGRLAADNDKLLFNYGRSYLEWIDQEQPAIAIYDTELPLQSGVLPLLNGLSIPGCIRDAAPDAWGRRVIINKQLHISGSQIDTASLDELTYLLESGSDRIGALDFQLSATEYIPRLSKNVSLDELLESSQRIEKGEPLTMALDLALFHGSSIGGARPKALIDGNNKKFIAKFPSSSDHYNVLKAEFISMRMAKIAGLNVASVELTKALNKDVLLIERFDRKASENGWQRKCMVSALTLLELDEMMARHASYEILAEIIRHKFNSPKQTLKELFSRLVFNILSGNTDDHARNHAAFWNGKYLELTPAYDICPQGRSGSIASQAMLISGNNNLSQLKYCVESCHQFQLSTDEARSIIGNQVDLIKQNWNMVCDQAQLSQVDKKLLWQRQFLNPFAFEGLD